MTIMINDSSRHAAGVAGLALSLAVRAEALADEIDAWPRQRHLHAQSHSLSAH
jgi:hypothetical protein